MLSSEVPSPDHPVPLERLLLDLFDPELKGRALFELRKVCYIAFPLNRLLHRLYSIYNFDVLFQK
jgi:hypothetical protein